jgi:hypothetical protein
MTPPFRNCLLSYSYRYELMGQRLRRGDRLRTSYEVRNSVVSDEVVAR